MYRTYLQRFALLCTFKLSSCAKAIFIERTISELKINACASSNIHHKLQSVALICTYMHKMVQINIFQGSRCVFQVFFLHLILEIEYDSSTFFYQFFLTQKNK